MLLKKNINSIINISKINIPENPYAEASGSKLFHYGKYGSWCIVPKCNIITGKKKKKAFVSILFIFPLAKVLNLSVQFFFNKKYITIEVHSYAPIKIRASPLVQLPSALLHYHPYLQSFYPCHSHFPPLNLVKYVMFLHAQKKLYEELNCMSTFLSFYRNFKR